MYTQDYDEMTPLHNDDDGSDGWRWFQFTILLSPYTKNYQILCCPSDNGWTEPAVGAGGRWSSYPVNTEIVRVSVARFEDPAGTIALFESPESDLGVDGNGDRPYAIPNNDVYNRHNGGFNANFTDGHAKWLKPDQTSVEDFTLADD
jgi:prepilin-type processing-associated H-X9-DG protein